LNIDDLVDRIVAVEMKVARSGLVIDDPPEECDAPTARVPET
jgi:hypothetical protein